MPREACPRSATLFHALAGNCHSDPTGAVLAFGIVVIAACVRGWVAAAVATMLVTLVLVVASLADRWSLGPHEAPPVAAAQEDAVRRWSPAEAEHAFRRMVASGLAAVCVEPAGSEVVALAAELPPEAKRFFEAYSAVTEHDGTELGWTHLGPSTRRAGSMRIGVEPDCAGEWSIARGEETVLYVEPVGRSPAGETVVAWPSIWHVGCVLAGCAVDLAAQDDMA